MSLNRARPGLLTCLIAYLCIFILNNAGALYFPEILAYLLPMCLLSVPLYLQGSINMRLSKRDALIGMAVSITTLLPFVAAKISGGAIFRLPEMSFLLITFVFTALPEEAFFRGFLLEGLGVNIKGVLISSLLFALAHGHRYFLIGDYLAFFTFFPSLIMGFLYVKTRNILPSVIFHWLSNAAFISVM